MAHVEGDRLAAPRLRSAMTSPAGGDLERAEREAVDWFARLRAGQPGDQQAFENWYASDQDHADAYDRVLRSWSVMGDVARAPSSPAERHLDGRRRSRGWLPLFSAVAAGVLLALLGFGLAGLGPDFLGSSPARKGGLFGGFDIILSTQNVLNERPALIATSLAATGKPTLARTSAAALSNTRWRSCSTPNLRATSVRRSEPAPTRIR